MWRKIKRLISAVWSAMTEKPTWFDRFEEEAEAQKHEEGSRV